MHLEPILSRYSLALNGLRWITVPGGFSGANVWRGDDAAGTAIFALKAWPVEMTAARLTSIHGWMAQAAHLPFVPTILRTNQGHTHVSQGAKNWDIQQWMPGESLASPSIAEVEAACAAVANLHLAWPIERHAVCPGILNRQRILSDFHTRFGKGLGSLVSVPESLVPLVQRAWEVVAVNSPWAEQLLRSWESVVVPLRPCVRDLRSEHVLFSQGSVRGIVDFGAMAVDHPAVDLARLLGDIAIENSALFDAGLRAYRAVVPFVESDEFVRILALTGRICSVVGWLVRLQRSVFCGEGEAPAEPRQRLGRSLALPGIEEEAITNRLRELVEGVVRFAPK